MRLIAGAFLFTILTPCQALDGMTLNEWCSQAIEKAPGRDVTTFRDGYCMGMTEGVAALARRSPKIFCAPDSTGNAMLMRNIMGYLSAHPERLKEPAESLILDALAEAFPCN